MRILFSALVTLSITTATSQNPHAHRKEKGEKLALHGLDRKEDGSLKSRYNAEDQVEFDHEAILGSRDEADVFDDLPPEEAKRRLKIILGKMDLNLNEHIERSELEAWIVKSLKSLNQEDNEERFGDDDIDHDGKLSWKEFKGSEYDSEDEEDMDEWMKEDHYLFQAADKDKDGSLTLAEFALFVEPGEDEEMRKHVLKVILDDKDLNKDGVISLDEFIGKRDKEHDEEWFNSEKERFNSELDTDKDGSLNSEEIISWIVPPGYETTAAEEATHLISEVDSDRKDGILSFEEILDKVDVFAGSEVTDFGNHLTDIHRFEEEL